MNQATGMRLAAVLTIAALISGCAPDEGTRTTENVDNLSTVAHTVESATAPPDEFGDYWYQGKAEITSYVLKQARYGELHEGTSVLIFVTEDFNKKTHVKVNDPATSADAVKILKLNSTKNFNTGIYPYSMMASVYTPLPHEELPTLRVTATSQEWCGHTFTQIRQTKKGYSADQFSYFDGEGDASYEFPDAISEDGLWNTLRINPDDLPTGKINLIPGLFSQRLRHSDWKVEPATAELTDSELGDGLMAYSINYEETDRNLVIHFEESVPHRIEGWDESYRSGFGSAAKSLTTTARRNKELMTDYWAKNSSSDVGLRAELGLGN